jgi:prolyl-tRNA synthetase
MRLSELFTKTSKNIPAGEIAKNAQLLIRAGYISKVMSGVYIYAPLGLRVLEKIKQIIREEMNSVGGQELIMSSLQKKETWDITGRWDDQIVDMWFKSKLKDGTQIGFAWSHEEAIIEMLKEYLASYKDLPINVYQFQTKFRNELRSKSGIMRGREFVMKDMYSCSIDENQHNQFYNDTIDAYNRVFERLGLKDETYMTFASGGAFTQFSHEFQTICDAGEDTIYLHRGKNIAINEDVMDDENLNKLGISREELEKVKTAEVGNIFNFGIKKSEDTNFSFTNSEGKKQFVYFGSYGIGVTRLMGVIVEKFSDEKGLVWPENIAPFKIYMLRIGGDEVVSYADDLYKVLTDKGFEVLYDDRDVHPGQKFADSELIGIPYRVTVSDRMIENNQYELVERKNGQKIVLTRDELLAKLG